MAVALLSACDRTPDGVIPPGEMASVLADIHTAESVVDTERRSFASDSMRRLLKQSVLARHGYNVADFDSSLSYYGRNIDLYAKLYEDVVEILEDRIALAESQAATDRNSVSSGLSPVDIVMDGDSVDVWNLPRTVVFARNSPVNIIPFNMTNDRYWEQGDIYTFRGKMNGASDAVAVSLAVEYMDGSTDYMVMRSMGNGWKEARLSTDTAKVARNMYGTITYPVKDMSPRTPVALDSITLYRTRKGPVIDRDARIRTVHLRR